MYLLKTRRMENVKAVENIEFKAQHLRIIYLIR